MIDGIRDAAKKGAAGTNFSITVGGPAALNLATSDAITRDQKFFCFVGPLIAFCISLLLFRSFRCLPLS